MADSDKSTVVIASVLKPVDDSRMYEKIGLTLANSGKYNVHIIGIQTTGTKSPAVVQHGLNPFSRVSFGRFLAPWRILQISLRVKPHMIIITTHELLYVGLLLKMIRKCRLVYDVRENYYWNILYTAAFPMLLKPFVALYVRGKEILSSRYVDYFFLAERGYESELKFPGNRYSIIENKVRIDSTQRSPQASAQAGKSLNLLFSGTLAETTGVFTAIALAVKLHVIDDRVRLTIIGFCSQHKVLEKIRLLIQPRPFIKLIVRDRPIPHGEIFDQIRQSDFGLVTYEINPSTMNSIPTKVYEYLGFRLPILLVNHRPWVDFCLPFGAAIVFDPAYLDAAAIYREMTEKQFYTVSPDGVYWSDEEPKLLDAVGKVLSDPGS